MAAHPASKDIASSLEQDCTFLHWSTVFGGNIHQSWKVQSTCNELFFIKTNHAAKFHAFEAEALGLTHLKQHIAGNNPLIVPEVQALGKNDSYAWLILNHITFSTDNEQDLGRGLAMLHQQKNKYFGFESDNVIGENPQWNTPSTNWLNFFQEQRLQAQFDLAKSNGIYHHFSSEAEQLLIILPILLSDHNPTPSLLHGDLWSGNKATDIQGKPIIFDPAVYYGDRECDLAMTELFGGFSPAFYAAYNHVYPLDAGYIQRKTLYNLYHILNHANLFGSGYIKQSKFMMQQLIKQTL